MARQEAEDNFKVLLQTLNDNIDISDRVILHAAYGHLHDNYMKFLQAPAANAVPVELLLKAEACCTRLLQKHDQDPELRALLSYVLIRLGNYYLNHGQHRECLAYFEKGARLFEQEPPEGARQRLYLHVATQAYAYLGAAYERQGRRDPAQQAFATSLRLWQQLAGDPPDAGWRVWALMDGLLIAQVLHSAGHTEEDIQSRFGRLRGRPQLLGGAPQYDRFLNLLHVQFVCLRAEKSGQPDAALAAAREASAILDRYHRDTSLDPSSRLWIALYSIEVGVRLRKGGAVAEALRLLEPTKRTLQELVREAPQDPDLFVNLGESWYQIGKAHWDLDQVEETLDACRHALEAQREAAKLAPSVIKYRDDLGWRHLQLGRKYCELGRLDEAEACFRERQALWPGDVAKYAETVAELRKWAAQAAAESSPEKRLECQRYLDLCARLEGKGVDAAAATAGGKP